MSPIRAFSRPALPLLLMIMAAACSSNDSTGVRSTRFTATLSPANEPSLRVPSQGSGTATFVFDGTSLAATVDVQNMDSVTAAHIHVGAPGVPGPIVLALFTGPVIAHVGATQTLVSKSFVASDITGAPAVSMDSLVALMRSGATYVNVHTRANPAGEIRGQIALKP